MKNKDGGEGEGEREREREREGGRGLIREGGGGVIERGSLIEDLRYSNAAKINMKLNLVILLLSFRWRSPVDNSVISGGPRTVHTRNGQDY